MTSSRHFVPFRAVNALGSARYRAGVQRHHILPRQLLEMAGIGDMIATIGAGCLGFHDFRHNGLLLPATDEEAVRMGLPLHRGPHHGYNQMVIERMGQIDAGWRKSRRAHGDARALVEAITRIDWLQRALRRRLLDPLNWRGAPLHARDPALDFSHLDRMANALWAETGMVTV